MTQSWVQAPWSVDSSSPHLHPIAVGTAGQFGHIQLGTSTDTQHRDGHIPLALVMELQESSPSTTVEGIEKGASKGKQVDLHLVFALNPHLVPKSTSMTSTEVTWV